MRAKETSARSKGQRPIDWLPPEFYELYYEILPQCLDATEARRIMEDHIAVVKRRQAAALGKSN